MNVYIDFNAWRHMGRGKVSPSTVEKIREAARDGRVSVIASYLVIQEAIGIAAYDLQEAKRQVAFIVDLSDSTKVVRDLGELLVEAVTAEMTVFQPFALQGKGILEAALRLTDEELYSVAVEAEKGKEAFLAGLNEKWDEVDAELAASSSPTYAEQIAARTKADAKQAKEETAQAYIRDIVGRKANLQVTDEKVSALLKDSRLRNLAYIGAAYVERSRNPQRGDLIDMQHALLAAVAGADYFVTHDVGLRTLLNMAGVRRPKTQTLEALAKELGSREPAPRGEVM